ncbi:MAG: thiamine pyrophosphate-dependent enzyme [Elusimicrobiota bacterium]
MKVIEKKAKKTKPAVKAARKGAKQVTVFKSGNEMAAMAGAHINFHVMGFYPITPSTEVAENLDAMRVEGYHNIRMVAGDGEHGAAGICYGASVGGGRVLNVTASQGILYSLEQLPVQSGTRFPMVLNIACRSVSGPLDIRGDHSDIYFALNAGWIMLLARSAQAVYDMNFIAVRIGEHAKVRLPVMVAYDGFFTSHQKRKVQIFEKGDPAIKRFIGEPNTPHHALDPKNPTTFGPYMNDPDLINNKYQQHQAMEAAYKELPRLFKEFEQLTGRSYGMIESYRMDDAEAALFVLNSAAETAKDVADKMRAEGHKVGVVSPTVIRPFPIADVQRAFRNVKAVVIGDRADSYGSGGGNMAHEVKAALKDDPGNSTVCINRVYGLGGLDFYQEDAEGWFHMALEAAKKGEVKKRFDYHGATPGDLKVVMKQILPPLTEKQTRNGLVKVEQDPETGLLKVKTAPLHRLTTAPNRFTPGHGACPGCGIFSSLRQFFMGIEGHVVVLFQTGCAMVVTTGYPSTSHRITYLHNLFQNGAPTLSGLVEMYHERKLRKELPDGLDITFVMVTGDGGMDIGMGPTIGTANRNHRMIILEYDNQAYMNTGAQLSYTTPMGHRTSTSNVGPIQAGKGYHHKDTVQIMAATHIPYVFSAVEGYPQDFIKKAAKAQWYSKREGMVYGKVLSFCPLNWRTADDMGSKVTQAAADSCFFPLYEVEKGKTRITYDPEAVGRKVPLKDYLGLMGKTKHMLAEKNSDLLAEAEREVRRRWTRLKAMHDHPLL